MDHIKKAVTQTLEKQGVIAQLKAQLRAQVLTAVEEYEQNSTGAGIASKTSNAQRDALLGDSDGELVVQLVMDLLDTCNFAFTRMVFQPECGRDIPGVDRLSLASKLTLSAGHDVPLLLSLVKACRQGPVRANEVPAKAANAPLAPLAPLASVAALKPAAPAAQEPSRQPAPAPAPSAKPAVAPAAAAKPVPAPATTAKPALPASKSSPPPPPVVVKNDDDEYAQDQLELEAPEVDDEILDEDVLDADEDDEDYAAVMGFKVPTGFAKPASAAAGSGLGKASGTLPDQSELELSNSSAQGALAAPGRLRAGRVRPSADDDIMAGDRSFGVSHELAGLDAGNSGALGMSNDFGGAGGTDAFRNSLSSSTGLSPLGEPGGKLAKLEPLRSSAGKLSPLAPLAPLGSSKPASLEDPSSKGAPSLGVPAPLGVRKSLPDIEKERDELRRLGLLQSGDSLGHSGGLPDVSGEQSGPGLASAGRPRGSIYDAEFSVSASMDFVDKDDAQGSAGRPYRGNAPKGLSMDFRETGGLSASDRSGDIGQLGADFAETAEWQ